MFFLTAVPLGLGIIAVILGMILGEVTSPTQPLLSIGFALIFTVLVGYGYFALIANAMGRGFFEKRIQLIHIIFFLALCLGTGMLGAALISTFGDMMSWWPSYGDVRSSVEAREDYRHDIMWPLFWANILIPFALGIIIRVAKRFSKKAMALA